MKKHLICFPEWRQEKKTIFALSDEHYQLVSNNFLPLNSLLILLAFKESPSTVTADHFPENIASPGPYRFLRFNHPISNRKVKKFLLEHLLYEPATLYETLNFFKGLPHPRPLAYDVIALGSRWHDHKNKTVRVPFIDHRWRLRLTFDEGNYTDQDVFLVRPHWVPETTEEAPV
ncbi:MAG: hypothetical protein WEA04_03880 [Candidatus Andersenbacteria bacterium]